MGSLPKDLLEFMMILTGRLTARWAPTTVIMSRVIAPFIGVVTPVTLFNLFMRLFIAGITPFITIVGAYLEEFLVPPRIIRFMFFGAAALDMDL